MKNIRTYEQFNFDYTDDSELLKNVNNILNHPKFNLIINEVPDYLKNKIRNFFKSGKILDMDKTKQIIKKYDIFDKVKNLYKSGVRNFNDIYKNIMKSVSPKNESIVSISIMIFILIILSAIAIYALIELFDGEWGVIIPLLIAIGIGIGLAHSIIYEVKARNISKELESKNIKTDCMTVIMNNKETTYMILTYPNGQKDTLTMKEFMEYDEKDNILKY